MLPKNIIDLPKEVLQLIQLQLPVDTSTIELALACKALYQSSVIGNTGFALVHFKCRLNAFLSFNSPEKTLWDYLEEAGLKGTSFKSLPVNSQAAIWFHIFTAIELKQPDAAESEEEAAIIYEQNLMNHTRWIVNPQRALEIYERLKTFNFDETSQDHRMFRWACASNYLEVAKILLKNPRTNPSANQNSPCHWSSKGGFNEILQLVLDDPRFDPTAGHPNILTSFAEFNRVDEMKRFINHANPADGNNEAIYVASFSGHLEIVRLLLADPRVDPSDKASNCFMAAAQNNHIEVVQALLQDARVDPSAQNNFALEAAVDGGHTKLVEILLQDPRVDPSFGNNNIIVLASHNNRPGIVRVLLQDSRVDPTVEEHTAFAFAAQEGYLEVCQELLKDPRIDPSVDEYSVVRMAVLVGHVNILKILLNDSRVSKQHAIKSWMIDISKTARRAEMVELLENALK
ncbi:UNVERIFIED_CONTAM: hypothetical protein HDU68_010375 [Siphonaria sp. JEL0065]|nr:hypothetical protein HDU68_010375 [Siphonaria sp. JEL0065]